MSVNYIPAGYHTATPYLVVKGAAAAIEFYKKVFGATEVMCFKTPDGYVCHAEIKIGDSVVMLGEENPKWGAVGPQTLGGTPVGLCLYFPDVDAKVAAAVAGGAKIDKPVQDQFYGDRSGTVIDPFGHKWTIATHVEDVTEEEVTRRMSAFMKQSSAA